MEIFKNSWINCIALDPYGRCLRKFFIFCMVHVNLIDELNIISLGTAMTFEMNPKYFNYVAF